MNLFIFLLILSFVSCISCESQCHTYKTCGTCRASVSEKCVWCSENKNITSFRCQPKSYEKNNRAWCHADAIFRPYYAKTITKNLEIQESVQFSPQKLLFKATPGEEVKFDVSYKPAKNFPLDVYFLMDYSYTMKTQRESLQKKALAIYKALTDLTNNVRLGLGGFVEKPGLPYTDINVANNKELTFAFKNHLNLTEHVEMFQTVIKTGSQFGTNYDDAEAGLDALMQVMMCIDELEWRNQTRRIIVLATDNTYHSAGDGKMLGIIKPNDMKCHLKDGEYKREDSLTYDYPSVSLINKAAKDGNFLIIFAAVNRVKEVYDGLSKQIPGSKYAELTEENIFDIIKAAYLESVGEVHIDENSPPSFQVKIDQDCSASPKRNCEITPNNLIVTIPVTIKSIECIADPTTIIIHPRGLPEKLEVTFEVDCQCDCEKAVPSEASKNCNERGFIQCGACKCNGNWSGDSCEINCSDENSVILEKKCFPANSMNKCNGHGTCECGRCTCTDGFTGKVCEYDPNSCEIGNNGQVCGGTDRGICQYGKCQCINDWTGDACNCLIPEKSDKLCIGPFSQKICSGNGQCNCGKCDCNVNKNTNERYSGKFCDVCNECATERCQELEGYAKCNHHNTKKDICDETFALTDEINLEVVVANETELNKMTEWNTGTKCRALLDDETYLLFKYNTNKKTSKMVIMIQKEVEVPPKANIWVPIASAIAAILLIGLLTVVFWKLLIELYDKREYNKFCAEATSQGYEVTRNELYEPPQQHFRNPGYDPTQNIQ